MKPRPEFHSRAHEGPRIGDEIRAPTSHRRRLRGRWPRVLRPRLHFTAGGPLFRGGVVASCRGGWSSDASDFPSPNLRGAARVPRGCNPVLSRMIVRPLLLPVSRNAGTATRAPRATAHSSQNGPVEWASPRFAEPAWLLGSNSRNGPAARSDTGREEGPCLRRCAVTTCQRHQGPPGPRRLLSLREDGEDS